MNALLICPGIRAEVAALGGKTPLCLAPFLGTNLMARWLEHLAVKGFKEVIVLATDRPEQVRAFVGDGSRWGLRARVLPEQRELSLDEARLKYQGSDPQSQLTSWDVLVPLDHPPFLPGHRVLASFRGWYEGQLALLSETASPTWIGMKEIQPGVWVHLRSRVAADVQFCAPCWVGEGARIDQGAQVGPGTIIGERSWVESGAEVVGSVVGPETLVGRMVELRDSLVWGSQLIQWATGSSTEVADPFLLCSLNRSRSWSGTLPWWSRLTALAIMAWTFPLALLPILKAKWRGRPAFQSRLAVRPHSKESHGMETILFYELCEASGWLRRWPQFWNVARGEFSWVGNRPLSPAEAATLATEFERLWLAGPIGLFSHGDAQGCPGSDSEEARAHAAYYTVTASRKMDLLILLRTLKRKLFSGHRNPGAP